jgi:hypothetical protein
MSSRPFPRTRVGFLGHLLGTPLGLSLLAAQFVLLLLFFGWFSERRSSDGCLSCHEDASRMEELGYPQFTVTAAEAQEQSRMPRTTCIDCHLGEGGTRDVEEAHQGLLRPFIVGRDGGLVPREGVMPSLLSSRDDPLRALLPAVERRGKLRTNPKVLTVMYHDRSRETFGYDPEISRLTCGRSNCHPDEVEQFDGTVMGSNFRQRSMTHWTDVHGPNNCGPSFADVAASLPAKEQGFSDVNTREIAGNLTVPFSREQAVDKQKVCNLCHTGCLDCHYTPSKERGIHGFTRRPPSSNCAGGGRGTMLCHGGTLERRRGDNYLGGAFTSPAGMEADTHLSLGMDCLDCHARGPAGMGDMKRAAGCSDCHLEAEEALAAGAHRRMSCAACHVSRLGGYQQTSWGPGNILKRPNPFKKYALYYGIIEPPLLMKDQEGTWTPYKVWGNSAGNIKEPVKSRPGVIFRWPDGETRDAYALLGTFGDLPENNLHLAWIQLDQASHPLGPSRDCDSCHGREDQVSRSSWKYVDGQGARPFSGSHVVTADREGLRIGEFEIDGEIELREGARLSDFAAWTFIGDRWTTEGDFSIPPSEESKVAAFERRYRMAEGYLDEEKLRLEGEDLPEKKFKLRLRRLRETWLHNPEAELPAPSGRR